MEIPKEKILDLIRERAGGEQADQAARDLPEQVDPEQHADLCRSSASIRRNSSAAAWATPPTSSASKRNRSPRRA